MRQPEVTTESVEREPFFTLVCTAVRMEPATTSYFVRWQLGNLTINVTEPLSSNGRTTLTAEDVVGLQMGDQVSSRICQCHIHIHGMLVALLEKH